MLQAPCVGSSRVAISADFFPPVWVFRPLRCRLCFTFRGRGGKGGLRVSFLSAWKDLGGVLCFPAAALREADLVPLQEPEPILALPGKEEGEFHARIFSVGGSDVHRDWELL